MSRIAREQELVVQMIQLYCKGHHSPSDGELCADCLALSEYARKRLDRCLWGEDKGFCSHCPRHCYAPRQREQIREVMRWAGYRMIWHRPAMVLAHLRDSLIAKYRGASKLTRQKVQDQTKENGRS